MSNEELDLGGGNNVDTTTTPPPAAAPSNEPVSEPTDINGGEPDKDSTDKTPDNNPPSSDNNGDSNNGNNDNNPLTGELEEGTEVEFEGQTYTVDKDGNLVDKDNKIFKKADEVADWIKEQEIDDDDINEFDIQAIRNAVGIDVVDEKGNPIEFTNDVNGIKSYIDSVVSIKTADVEDAVMNKFYQDNPIVKDFINYISVNGTYEGFGEIKDRSNIVLDKNNKAQLEAVIRMAAKEFGNASLSDSYINYLRDNDGLFDEATVQLQNLQNYDAQVREELARRAEANRQKEIEDTQKYWKRVDEVVKSRKIGKYEIPENITKEVDGKKVMYNINDFYDYLSKPAFVDEQGNQLTAYQRDLAIMSDEDLLNTEILDAYLHFSGGTYEDLINMAIKENEVRKLKIKAREHRAAKSVKVNRPNNAKSNINDISLA